MSANWSFVTQIEGGGVQRRAAVRRQRPALIPGGLAVFDVSYFCCRCGFDMRRRRRGWSRGQVTTGEERGPDTRALEWLRIHIHAKITGHHTWTVAARTTGRFPSGELTSSCSGGHVSTGNTQLAKLMLVMKDKHYTPELQGVEASSGFTVAFSSVWTLSWSNHRWSALTSWLMPEKQIKSRRQQRRKTNVPTVTTPSISPRKFCLWQNFVFYTRWHLVEQSLQVGSRAVTALNSPVHHLFMAGAFVPPHKRRRVYTGRQGDTLNNTQINKDHPARR